MTIALIALLAGFCCLALLIASAELFKYFKVRAVYGSGSWIKGYKLAQIRRLGFLIPRLNAKGFKYSRRLLEDSGSRLNVEELYLIKWLLVLLVMMLFAGIYFTNLSYELGALREDLNFGKVVTDSPKQMSSEARQKEAALTKLIEGQRRRLDNLGRMGNKSSMIKTIQKLLEDKGIRLHEPPEIVAERLYYKLIWIRQKSSSMQPVLMALLLCYLAYMLPSALIHLFAMLKVWKRPLEVMSLYNVFSICGRVDPFDIRVVLQNMILVAEVYKPLLEELYENIKLNKGDSAYDAVLEKSSCENIKELVEILKTAGGTGGIQNLILEVDQTSEYKMKWIEIDSITKREDRTKYVMIPVGLMLLLGMLYFSLGMTLVSNPYTFLGK